MLASIPHNSYWQIDELMFENEILRIGVTELMAISTDVAEPITIHGVEIRGNCIKPRSNSKCVSFTFLNTIEFRVMPEVFSWPAYEDGEEMIPGLLYQQPGLYFYDEPWSQDYQTFHSHLGWVKAAELSCYIIHTETVDIYVLTNSPPSIA
jgi:hypothetical protein